MLNNTIVVEGKSQKHFQKHEVSLMKHKTARLVVVSATILLGISLMMVGVCPAQRFRPRPGPWAWDDTPYYHASTAQESMARGMADMVRAAGQARLLDSAAANNYEDARAKAMENKLRATEIYYERRRIGLAHRDQARKKRSASQRAYRTFRLNKKTQPQPLTPSQLDPVTGEIHWPKVLLKAAFAPERRVLDRLFAERAAQEGVLTPEQLKELQTVGDKLREHLRKMIRDIPAKDYLEATSFLKSLLYEPLRQAG